MDTKKPRSIMYALLTLMVFVVSIGMVQATNCGDGSTSCALNATTSIGNVAPTVISVTAPSPITLTAGDNVTYAFSFIAEDGNGYLNLNDSSASIVVSRSGEGITPTSASCSATMLTAIRTNYTCNVVFPYHAKAGVWDVTAYITDKANANANGTTTTTINSLNALDYSNSIAFSGLVPGTNNNAADTPVTFSNKGNGDYTAVAVTMYNSTNGNLDVISASNYAIDITPSTCAVTGVEGTPQAVAGSVLTYGPTATEVLYPCVSLPAGTPSGTYNADNNWMFAFS